MGTISRSALTIVSGIRIDEQRGSRAPNDPDYEVHGRWRKAYLSIDESLCL